MTKSFCKKNQGPAQWLGLGLRLELANPNPNPIQIFKGVADFPTGILPSKRQITDLCVT